MNTYKDLQILLELITHEINVLDNKNDKQAIDPQNWKECDRKWQNERQHEPSPKEEATISLSNSQHNIFHNHAEG